MNILKMNIPGVIPNWINGVEKVSVNNETFSKLNPADGIQIFQVARSVNEDINLAVESCKSAQPDWADVPPVKRGLILHDIVRTMIDKKEEIAHFVHIETGKSMNDALGEVGGAIECGLFYASEGQRLYPGRRRFSQPQRAGGSFCVQCFCFLSQNFSKNRPSFYLLSCHGVLKY